MDSMEPAMFSLSLQGGRAEFEGRGVEIFAYMDNVTLGLMGISTSTVRNILLLRRELDGNHHRRQRRQDVGATSTENVTFRQRRYFALGKCRRPNGRGEEVDGDRRLKRHQIVCCRARGWGNKRWRQGYAWRIAW